MELVAVGAVGALVVVLVVVLVSRLRGDGDDVVSGLPPAPPPGAAGSRASAGRVEPVQGTEGRKRRGLGFSFGFKELSDAFDGPMQQMLTQIQEALDGDGRLSDEDVARLFPGATVVRSGSDVRIEHSTGWGALDWGQGNQHHHVEWTKGPSHSVVIEVDGRRIGDPSEITDPEVRTRVEQVLRDLGR